MENKHNNAPNQEKSDGKPSRPSLTIDYALYWHYLDNSDLSDAQKRDWLDDFWMIIVSFVDLGFDVHPLQRSVDQNDETGPCEQNAIIRDFIAAGAPDVVDLSTKSRSQSKMNNGVQSGISE